MKNFYFILFAVTLFFATIPAHKTPRSFLTADVKPNQVEKLKFTTRCIGGSPATIGLRLTVVYKDGSTQVLAFSTEGAAWAYATASRFNGKLLVWNGVKFIVAPGLIYPGAILLCPHS